MTARDLAPSAAGETAGPVAAFWANVKKAPSAAACEAEVERAVELVSRRLIAEREGLRGHLKGMCDAYELLCLQSGMKYHESPSSKYVAARQALHAGEAK